MIYKETTVAPISYEGRVETLNYKGRTHAFYGPSFVGKVMDSYSKNGEPFEKADFKTEDPS